MKIYLLNTAEGLKPLYDEDYDQKKRLKIGEVYSAEVRTPRSVPFLRKYFALVRAGWGYLPERQRNGFRNNVELWRTYCQAAAGYVTPWYSPKEKRWYEIPQSIAFDSMNEETFSELYQRVYDVIFSIIGRFVSEEEFRNNLSNF